MKALWQRGKKRGSKSTTAYPGKEGKFKTRKQKGRRHTLSRDLEGSPLSCGFSALQIAEDWKKIKKDEKS